ncbi:bifunctional riboflavin kinase/FAD synthetase [Bacillus alkalisoli]|uniref:bifunctional riboflavin kinase/FAD synthetase n=1 Tax=Bacillus alkalisoli TaxID=2011008 RepID=UPI000C251593|nr:bifunctional riboflavin kinase/FAD synthetase [Bacillus alkalisoli]
MKTVYLEHPHHLLKTDCPSTVMALGFFDGIHLGHQKVIKTAINHANKTNRKSAVLTLDPHPSVVLGRDIQHIRYITPISEKKRILEQLGVDILYIVNFSHQFASLEPQQFVDQYIIDLHVEHVVAGFDFSYGRLGKGTMQTLPFHSRQVFSQTIVDKLANGEEKVSSTLVRKQLMDGKVDELTETLGRNYSISGTVSHGDKRGRKIGFPTANVQLNDEFLLPKTGVYAVKLTVSGLTYNGVCNVGYKPTFYENQQITFPSIEVNLFEFHQEIYGETVTVEFFQRIRNEQKFNSIEELINQIQQDKEKAIHFFTTERN